MDCVNRTRRIDPKTFRLGFPRHFFPFGSSDGSESFQAQPNLGTVFTKSDSTLFVALPVLKAQFRIFTWFFFILAVREQTLVPCFASRFILMEVALGRMPILTRRPRAGTFQMVSARLSKNAASLTSASGASFARRTSTSCH